MRLPLWKEVAEAGEWDAVEPVPAKVRRKVENRTQKRKKTMQTVLLVILVLLLIGALPAWPYSSGWGYYPSGALTLILLIVLIAALVRRV